MKVISQSSHTILFTLHSSTMTREKRKKHLKNVIRHMRIFQFFILFSVHLTLPLQRKQSIISVSVLLCHEQKSQGMYLLLSMQSGHQFTMNEIFPFLLFPFPFFFTVNFSSKLRSLCSLWKEDYCRLCCKQLLISGRV